MKTLSLALAAACVAALSLAACGSTSDSSGSGESTSSSGPAAEPTIAVAAAFYPLQWASEQVGGDLVQVTGLTKPGGEPHDLELTPKAVAELAESDVVVYLRGFQPAVDEAVDTQAEKSAFDVSTDAGLDIAAVADAHEGEEGHAAGEKEGKDDGADGAGADGTKDPHFWLDPQRFQKVVTTLGERFAAADTANAATYRANATALVA
ncbi:MAG: metal ABC transporter substrate-binding protein, partial [Dermatophilaceae bacterium]